MKKLLTSLIIILIILAVAISFVSIKLISSSEQKMSKTYSYTKAICNKDNFCQDTVIVCDNDKIVSAYPITGAAVRFPQDWKDPRTAEAIKTFCWN